LQLLHLDVLKVYWMLHMDAYGKPEGVQTVPVRAMFRQHGPHIGKGDAGAIEWSLGGMGPCVDTRYGGETDYSGRCPSKLLGASSAPIYMNPMNNSANFIEH